MCRSVESNALSTLNACTHQAAELAYKGINSKMFYNYCASAVGDFFRKPHNNQRRPTKMPPSTLALKAASICLVNTAANGLILSHSERENSGSLQP